MKLLRKKTPSVVKHAEPENPLLSKIRDIWTELKRLDNRDKETLARANWSDMEWRHRAERFETRIYGLEKKLEILEPKVLACGEAAQQLVETDTKLIKVLQTGGRVTFD